MKAEIRILGVDDGPFSFADKVGEEEKRVEIVGVVVRSPSYVEGYLFSDVAVDGDDATDRVAEMVLGSRFRETLSLLMLDGIALGGFNVVDIEALHRRLGIPVLTVTKKDPDLEAMERALRQHFDDWAWRTEVLRRLPLEVVETAHTPIRILRAGISLEEAKGVIRRTTIRGRIPEPLRLAQLLARDLGVGRPPRGQPPGTPSSESGTGGGPPARPGP